MGVRAVHDPPVTFAQLAAYSRRKPGGFGRALRYITRIGGSWISGSPMKYRTGLNLFLPSWIRSRGLFSHLKKLLNYCKVLM
jgi:hypothetical protein